MKNNIYLIVSIIFLLHASGCRKEEKPQFRTDKLDGEKSILIGRWQWIYTVAEYDLCYPPSYTVILTPITESKTHYIKFYEEGYVSFDNNDLKRVVFLNWIQTSSLDPKRKYLFGFSLNNLEDVNPSGWVGSDTLILSGYSINEPYSSIGCNGCCRYTNYFVKI